MKIAIYYFINFCIMQYQELSSVFNEDIQTVTG